MRFLLSGVCALAAMVCCVGPASAAMIFASPQANGSGGGSSPIDTIRFRYGWSYNFPAFDVVLFDVRLDSLHAGDVLVADASNPNFSLFAAAVTDGLAVGGIRHERQGSQGGGGSSTNEAFYFHGDSTGAHGIDLTGYRIDRVSLIVDSFSHTTTGNLTSVTLLFRVEYEGEPVSPVGVPEPSSLTLAGIGLVALAGTRLRRRLARIP